MNYLFGADDEKDPDVERGESSVSETTRMSNASDYAEDQDSMNQWLKENNELDLDQIDVNSTDAVLASKSKQAVLKYIEAMVDEQAREGELSTEDILASVSQAMSADNKLSRQTIIQFIKEKKNKLEEKNKARKLKETKRKHADDEFNMLDSVKQRADSHLLDDEEETMVGVRRVEDSQLYDAPEFLKLRYTPVSHGVAEFVDMGYQLRCVAENKRSPRLMVVLTIREEGPTALVDSLRAIGDNILGMKESEQRFKGFGMNIWDDVLVCIVVDGRHNMNEDTAQWLEEFGLLQQDGMKYRVNTQNDSGELESRRTVAHLFERTVLLDKQLSKGGMLRKKNNTSGMRDTSTIVPLPPLQTVLCIKEHQAGQLDSHWWFYEAFCAEIQPDFVITMEAGCAPTQRSFNALITEMVTNRYAAGASGELNVKHTYSNPFNIIRLSQQFEFKATGLLNRCYQAAFGCVVDMPSQFAGFRFAALRGSPLDTYFKPLEADLDEMSPFQTNMFHARNQILTTELLMKRGKRLQLTHVWGVSADVDVPSSFTKFIVDRRDKFNSDLFARLYLLRNFFRFYTQASHDTIRRMFMFVFIFWQIVQLLFGWFQVALFLTAINYLVISDLPNDLIPGINAADVPTGFVTFVLIGYGCVFIMQVVMAMGNKLSHVVPMYVIAAVWYSLLSNLMLFLLGCRVVPWFTDENMFYGVWAGAGAIGCVFAASLLNLRLHHAVFTMIPYILVLPVVINVVPFYALANLDNLELKLDVFNPTEVVNVASRVKKLRKELGKRYRNYDPASVQFFAAEKDKAAFDKRMAQREGKNTNFRSVMFIGFIFTQVLFVGLVQEFANSQQYFRAVALGLGGLLGFKLICTIYYLIKTATKTFLLMLFNRFGFKKVMRLHGEEMTRRVDIQARKDMETKADPLAQMDRVFDTSTGNNSVMFVREARDDGEGGVRETALGDRRFINTQV